MGYLTSAAEDILAKCRRLDAYVDSSNLGPIITGEATEQVLLYHETLQDAPSELRDQHAALIDAISSLRAAALSPVELIRENSYSFSILGAINAVNRHRLASLIQPGPPSTIRGVAEAAGLPVDIVTRYLRMAAHQYILHLPTPDTVTHTPASLALRNNAGLQDEVHLLTSEIAPSVVCLDRAERTFGPEFAVEPDKTGFNIAHNSADSLHVTLASDPPRAARFGSAMRFMTSGLTGSLSHLNHSLHYVWSNIVNQNGILIDVGGGQGAVSTALAASNPGLRCVVQDVSTVVEAGRTNLPVDLRDRVSFEAHDFFSDQSKRDRPAVYLLRWILHNWSDKYCIDIIRALVPGLTEGSRVIIYEYVLDDTPSPGSVQDWYRHTSDLVMLSALSGKERTQQQFRELFRRADTRFKINAVMQSKQSALSALEIVFQKDATAGEQEV